MQQHTTHRVFRLLPLLGLLLAASPGVEARAADGTDGLTEMELETRLFEPAWIDGMDQAACDARLVPEAIGRDVVLMIFWDNANARSVRAFPAAKRLQRRYPDLQIIGVHGATDAAAAAERSARFGFDTATDTDGLAKQLGIDTTPMFMLVDRAGAIREVSGEQTDVSNVLSDAMADDAAAAMEDLEARRAALAKARADAERRAAEPAAAPSERPDAAAYERARWPKHNDEQLLNALDFQGRELPVPFGETETWITDKPEVPLNERVLVLDFWAVWCGPCLAVSPKLDSLQRQHADAIYVIGVGGQNENVQKVRSYVSGHPVSYHHVFDGEQKLYRKLRVRAIPHVAIVSTDGVIRWQGNPHQASFQQALQQVIKADPLLAAARK